jgi:hypothetical protein
MTANIGSPQADTLTQRIGVLVRREVEARILIPMIEAMSEAYGRQEVTKIVARTITRIARQQGADLARMMGGNSVAHFMESLQFWTQDNALELRIHRQDAVALDFDVTRCRYAEMYLALGEPQLGQVLSCNRDFALIDGFNPQAGLKRTQTIMEGAAFCDFRYTFPSP